MHNTYGLGAVAGRLAGVALVSGAALVAGACGGQEHAAEAVTARAPVTVTMQEVRRAPRPAMVEAGGLVQAKSSALVTSRLMAPVREVRVVPGDLGRKALAVERDGRQAGVR